MSALTEFHRGPFRFTLPLSERAGTRITAIIGPNGSGKSRILGSIADAVPGDTKFSTILAVSNLVTDSFPFTSKRDGYFYLGVRQATNSTTTGALKTLLTQSILLTFREQWRVDLLYEGLKVIGGATIRLVALENKPVRRKAKPDQPVRILGELRLDLGVAIDGLRTEIDSLRRDLEKGDALVWRRLLDAMAHVGRNYGVQLADIALALERRGHLRLEVQIHSPGRLLSPDDLSAGQLMLLSLVARISAYVEPGALVLIDEPEVGLHPTWQSAVIPLLRKIPTRFGVHVVIASHSPHVVTEADDVLVPSEEWGTFENYGDPFNGRSVEQVLYRVFEARVVGNTMVDDDLTTITSFLAGLNDVDRQTASDAADRLRGVVGPDTPVVKDVIDTLDRELHE